MTDGRRRLVIVVVALAAGVIFVLGLLLLVGSTIGCEDAEDSAFGTVRCDSERGAGWRTVQGVLLVALGLALAGGTIYALVRARILAVAVPAAATVPVLALVLAISGIEVGDKPLPRLTEVRLIDQGCKVPCANGIRVLVGVDRPAEIDLHLGPARFEDIGDRQYRSGALGDPDGVVSVDAGRHELRAGGEIVNPPAERGPLPPGPYELEVTARPQDGGNQRPRALPPVKRQVTIAP